ncbi:MAG: hypothetical protein ACRC2R_05105 [Xenococcaceae cyanobacterium]
MKLLILVVIDRDRLATLLDFLIVRIPKLESPHSIELLLPN